MAAEIDIKPYVEIVRREFSIVSGALKAGGSKRFGRVFIIAAAAVFAAYGGIYRPAQNKKALLATEIKRAKMMSDYAGRYKSLRDSLNAAYGILPAAEERGQWLMNSVRESLGAGNLTPDDFQPVREEELSGLVYQTSLVRLSVRFPDFFEWLLRVESAKPFMSMSRVDLRKNAAGPNNGTFEIATVIPVKRYR